jgi:hypothetical protein
MFDYSPNNKFKVDLTPEEENKYDEIYKKIIANYTKKEMAILEGDEIAQFYLKNIILKYVLTGEFPTKTDINNNIHLFKDDELIEHYDAKIPIPEKSGEINNL